MFYEVSSAHATRNEVMKMTLTVELDENLVRELEARAQQLAVSPSELAATQLRRFLEAPDDIASNEEFEVVARRAIARDDELLQRLAR